MNTRFVLSLAVIALLAAALASPAIGQDEPIEEFGPTSDIGVFDPLGLPALDDTPGPAVFVENRAAGFDLSAVLGSYLIGGSGNDIVRAIELGPLGDVYVAGYTNSPDFPTTAGASDTTMGGVWDGFLIRLTPGGSVVYATLIGGSERDLIMDLTVDLDGDAYVVGSTRSSDFPITAAAFDSTANGNSDGFVTKVSADGSSLLFSTFLGGFGEETLYAVTIDANEDVYVGGTTRFSTDYPTTPGAYDTTYAPATVPVTYGRDGVVSKLSADGTSLVFSTYLGVGGDEMVSGIAVDASQAVYLTGGIKSPDFPVTTGAFDTSYGGTRCYLYGSNPRIWTSCTEGFLTKLSPDGSSLIYSGFIGGWVDDSGHQVTVDESGAAYVVGDTRSHNFPTSYDAFDRVVSGSCGYYCAEPFVMKVDPSGATVLYATALGGSNHDSIYGLELDENGNAYLAGWSMSTDNPAVPGTPSGPYDAFAIVLNTDASGVLHLSRLGGAGYDIAYSLARGPDGTSWVGGYTGSADFPTTDGSALRGLSDGFAINLEMAFDAEPPTWPDGASIEATNRQMTNIQVAWTAASDDTAVFKYEIYRDGLLYRTLAPSTSSTYISGTPATDYLISVRACDLALNCSDGPSATLSTLTPAEGIEALGDQVGALEIPAGLATALGSKLDAAQQALADSNDNNDVAAINALEAFINTVEAQQGKKLTYYEGWVLIQTAQTIINLLS